MVYKIYPQLLVTLLQNPMLVISVLTNDQR